MKAITGIFCLITVFGVACNSTTTTRTDAQMESAIRGQYSGDPELAELNVSAKSSSNEATLSGTVHTQEKREQAVRLAKDAIPSLVLTDKIDVKPMEVTLAQFTDGMAAEARAKAKQAGDKIGTSIDDAWLHTKITTKILKEIDTDGLKINVDVDNGSVTLRGSVQNPTLKDRAGNIARTTEGVAGVTNRIVVKG